MRQVPQIPLAEGDRWMRGSEVANVFGVHPETISRWRRVGQLTGYQVAKFLWFKKSDVNALLAKASLPTI